MVKNDVFGLVGVGVIASFAWAVGIWDTAGADGRLVAYW